VAVELARSKLQKFSLLLFCSQKRRLFLLLKILAAVRYWPGQVPYGLLLGELHISFLKEGCMDIVYKRPAGMFFGGSLRG
jgi:hypothetical protein